MDILDYISSDEKLSADPSVSSLVVLLQKCVLNENRSLNSNQYNFESRKLFLNYTFWRFI